MVIDFIDAQQLATTASVAIKTTTTTPADAARRRDIQEGPSSPPSGGCRASHAQAETAPPTITHLHCHAAAGAGSCVPRQEVCMVLDRCDTGAHMCAGDNSAVASYRETTATAT